MPLLPKIDRPQLVAEVSDLDLRVVKLIAPAGYGKTTLARNAIDRAAHSMWVDLQGSDSNIEFYRRFASAASLLAPESIRNDLPERNLSLGQDVRGWRDLAEESVAWPRGRFTLVLDNAEEAQRLPELCRAIEDLVVSSKRDFRVVVCSRSNVFHFGRFAGPDTTLLLSPRSLRFSRDEISQVFQSLALSGAQLDAIERFTGGWPIVVMMLFALAKRGRLSAYLQQQEDVADLYGYLASQVLTTLTAEQSSLLDALAAIPSASLTELSLLFPNIDVTQAISVLEAESPFVSRSNGTLELHPALREMLIDRVDVDSYRARLYDLVYRLDGGTRAAELALLRNRPGDAGRALADGAEPGGFLIPQRSEILSALPEQVFIDYPVLWGAAIQFRASHDATNAILVGRRLLAEMANETPASVRIDIMASTTQMLANRGHLIDAQELADRLLTEPSLSGNPLAALLHAFFCRIIALYRGDPIDIVHFQSEFAELFAAYPMQQAFRDFIVIAAYYRAHGNYDLETAALERGLEIGRATKAPVAVAGGATYGAMSAWFWGDEARFIRFVEEAEASVVPSIANGFAHFLACARGRGHLATPGAEKMDMRVYGYAIAATLATTDRDRLKFGELALLAARHSSMRFCEVLARLVVGLTDPRQSEVQFNRADELAQEMESVPLQRALAAARAGNAKGTMLESLVRRLSPPNATELGAVEIIVDMRNGTLRARDGSLRLSGRELELFVFLALQPAPADARVIAATLWSDSDSERGLLSLRVATNRLRKRLGDPGVIAVTHLGYSLRSQVKLEPTSRAQWSPVIVRSWQWLSEYPQAVSNRRAGNVS